MQIQVALRYDRAQSQRKHFLHEAELATSLDHENILQLYGAVLPGLYIDSVALVSVSVTSSRRSVSWGAAGAKTASKKRSGEVQCRKAREFP